MTPVEVFETLASAADRAGALRALPADDIREALGYLLARGEALGMVDPGELLLLLVQRFDFALFDLDLADRYRLAPAITEGELEPVLAALALRVLGAESSPGYLATLVRRTRVAARRLDNIGDPVNEANVLDTAIRDDGSLRCAYCGYQFRLQDVRESLLAQISPELIDWATEISPGRARDQWKPVRTVNRQGAPHTWTDLEIEHCVPEVALGPSTSDNLTIACRWCNQGKAMYRSFAEIAPGNVAVSLSSIHTPWSLWYVQRAFYAAVTRASECETCRATPASVELTVRPQQQRAGLRAPAWPAVVCYHC